MTVTKHTAYAPGSEIITANSYANQQRLAGTYVRSSNGHRRRAWLPPRSVNLRMRTHIIERDGEACAECGKKTTLLHLDHIKPYRLGGIYIEWNLQLLCESCNARKGAKWDGC
jgi:5-methylcytosine-specific restriction endonuclease McrA